MAEEQAYITWNPSNPEERAAAFKQYGEALEQSRGTNIYMDAAPNNVSIRDGFNRRDYDYFRRDEAVPTKPKDLIKACDEACDNNGIVGNIISLMADFTCKGIKLVHPNSRNEKFYQEWAKKVHLKQVAERFAYYLYRHGTVLVKRQIAKLTVKDEENLKRAQAETDVDVEPPISLAKREVPWRYTFLHPCSVELLSEELAPFLGPEGFVYAVKIPKNLANRLANPKSDNDKLIVSKLPADIRRAIKRGDTLLSIDPNKLSVHFYKRDDWRAWPRPLIAPLLPDLNMLAKMKLGDLAALDGAISCIRVWKLGDLEKGIMPHPKTMLRLAEMLTNNVGGGVMDLVWGPDLQLVETSTEVHRFLGSTKYGPVLQLIYSGLGIPQSLTGSEKNQGFTNNSMALKTLTERLQYGRSILKEFVEQECALVQKAMGFRFPATVDFDDMLEDSATQWNILRDMADRDLIDNESLQEEMGFNPDVISVRQKRERRARKEGKVAAKASPFHDANHAANLEKVFAGTGVYTPDEFGMELKPKKEGGVPPAEQTAKLKKKYEPKPKVPGGKTKGQPGQGRPKTKKDSTKRKTKVVKPKRVTAFVENLAVAEGMLSSISELTTPIYLKSVNKKTQRELTESQSKDFESFKFALLNQFALGAEVNEESIKAFVQNPLPIPEPVTALLKKTLAKHLENNGEPPTINTLRRYQASIYALYQGNYEEAGDSDNGLS